MVTVRDIQHTCKRYFSYESILTRIPVLVSLPTFQYSSVVLTDAIDVNKSVHFLDGPYMS